MVKEYIKRPVVVEALQWTGENIEELIEFADDTMFFAYSEGPFFETLEGTMKACEGDYIIKGVKGEFYPCKPEIFEETYAEIEDG